jgi:broad specificity phosphatase PhoE
MTEPATLVLVRHGETQGESSIRYHGSTDVELSDLGRRQMDAVRAALDARFGAAPGLVLASPLSRALEGARIVAGSACSVTPIEEFREIHFGLFEGLTAEEISRRFPDEYRRWMSARGAPDFAFPAGESRRGFTARVERGLELALRLVDRKIAPDAWTLVVAHRGVIRTIVRRLTGAEPTVELGSIQILQRGSGWRATHLDLVDHLDSA